MARVHAIVRSVLLPAAREAAGPLQGKKAKCERQRGKGERHNARGKGRRAAGGNLTGWVTPQGGRRIPLVPEAPAEQSALWAAPTQCNWLVDPTMAHHPPGCCWVHGICFHNHFLFIHFLINFLIEYSIFILNSQFLVI